MTHYLLAGGGTAGHVNPLLALADCISAKEQDSQIWTLGTREGLEANLIPARGYRLEYIAKLPFPRKPSIYALKFPQKFFAAVREVRNLIRANQIDVVIGFGGYASAPAYIAAKREKVKLVIHEANALPGIANKIGAKFADVVATAFAGTPLPRANEVGMPLRREIELVAEARDTKAARKHFGLDQDNFTLLVTGGSLGAKRINETIEESRDLLAAAGVQILHIVGGKSDFEPVKETGYLRIKYCDRMDLALSACDFAISRAGATTVAELSAIGIPALYLPYSVGNGEQAHNLKSVIAAGGGIACADQDFDRAYVLRELVPLLSSSKKLKAMAEAARGVGVRNGTERLYALVSGVLTK
jgi:UDP-N-acetylglucosamine--N-acetylmuramyl-(pentapeptide) pyrophosphoryl-undecaprenol N-acetylglucosamine transferase